MLGPSKQVAVPVGCCPPAVASYNLAPSPAGKACTPVEMPADISLRQQSVCILALATRQHDVQSQQQLCSVLALTGPHIHLVAGGGPAVSAAPPLISMITTTTTGIIVIFIVIVIVGRDSLGCLQRRARSRGLAVPLSWQSLSKHSAGLRLGTRNPTGFGRASKLSPET